MCVNYQAYISLVDGIGKQWFLPKLHVIFELLNLNQS